MMRLAQTMVVRKPAPAQQAPAELKIVQRRAQQRSVQAIVSTTAKSATATKIRIGLVAAASMVRVTGAARGRAPRRNTLIAAASTAVSAAAVASAATVTGAAAVAAKSNAAAVIEVNMTVEVRSSAAAVQLIAGETVDPSHPVQHRTVTVTGVSANVTDLVHRVGLVHPHAHIDTEATAAVRGRVHVHALRSSRSWSLTRTQSSSNLSVTKSCVD